MQITTATRTVEIYANNEAGITYRNTKDGVAFGPVRTADRATAKAGSVGREILDALDALDAQAATEAEVVETEVATETVAPVATVAAQVAPVATVAAQVAEVGTTAEVAAPAPARKARSLAERQRIARNARVRRAVGLKW